MKYAIKKNVVSINEKSGRPNEMRHGTCSKYLKSILMSILKLYEKEKNTTISVQYQNSIKKT